MLKTFCDLPNERIVVSSAGVSLQFTKVFVQTVLIHATVVASKKVKRNRPKARLNGKGTKTATVDLKDVRRNE
jgi:hypothetical protein